MNSTDNYYDISIKSKRKPSNLSSANLSSTSLHIIPKRNSNPNLHEMKRPGDYYIQKLSSSSINFQAKRPISGDSIISLNSTYSDDISLNSENHDSRLSSMTSNSIISPNESPQINSFKMDDSINSLSTIIDTNNSETPTQTPSQTPINTPNIINVPETRKLPQRANTSPMLSTKSNISSSAKSINSSNSSVTGLGLSNSTTSLSRTKTKYFSQSEIKRRQQIRKKQYDDSYNEDEILTNDLDLVFNVPIIKNQSELFFKKNLSRAYDDKYKPFPLPGKLRSNSSPNISKTMTSNISIDSNISSLVVEDSIVEENESESESSYNDSSVNETVDDDSQIASNLSSYYTERSKSYSRLIKMSRQENMLYKLPKYVKSQSSLDDINLMSPEKLNMIDQTRPINLPPKLETDILRHNRELQKIYKDFEHFDVNNKDDDDFKPEWIKLLEHDVSKVNKNVLRKLNWNSNCPSDKRYEYLTSLLGDQELLAKVNDNFSQVSKLYENVNESIKTNRLEEFNRTFERLISKPFFNSINLYMYKQEFIDLMFLKSLNNSLHKHDEMFLIPLILVTFQDVDLKGKYTLIELFNAKIFNKSFIVEVNSSLENWCNKLPKRVRPLLENIPNKEFENLNFIRFIEVFSQLNDKLPLSVSASNPSTPILKRTISCAGELGYKFLQLTAIYSLSQAKNFNLMKIIQSFLVVIIKYYHINWLEFNDLLKFNKSVKLNFNMDNVINLNNFNDKWSGVFRKL